MNFFADLNSSVADLTNGSVQQRWLSRDVLIAISAALGVALLIVLWAVFIRKPREEEEYPLPPAPAPQPEGERRKRRRRRRRRDHRPRNPSLHQTGGLPPKRPEDQSPKY